MRLASTTALVALGVATAACRDTNILPPPPPDTAGGVIVFASDRSDNNSEIFRVYADGRGLRRLTTSRDANDRAPALSPDGSRIAWEREITTASGDVTAVEIWTMDVDGGDTHAVVSNGSFNRAPSWAPDGSLVFSSFLSGSDQVYRLAPGSATPVRLTTGGAADQSPRVSPDGGAVIFQSNRGLDFDIYVMRIDGSEVVNLTNQGGDDRFPAWSPDGSRIVWTRFDERTLSFDLWWMRADGTEAEPLVATPFNETSPSFSPDGSHVVFQSDRVPPARLFVADVATGEPRALSADAARSGSDQAPWWGPARLGTAR